MNISIKLTNIEMTDAINDYVNSKLGSIEKYMDDHHKEVSMIQVEIGRPSEHHHSGDVFYAEGTLSFDSTVLRAEVQKDDLYAAIDVLKDKLAEQFREYKDRLVSSHHK